MRVVRDCREARWLPSRFQFAIFRLAGFLTLRKRAHRHTPGVILVIDEQQSAIENHLLSVVMPGIVVLYSVALFHARIGTALSVAAGVLLPFFFILPGAAIAPLMRRLGRTPPAQSRLNQAVMLMAVTLASVYFAMAAGWVRWIGRSFLAALAVNLAAAALLWIARDRVAALEREYGAGA